MKAIFQRAALGFLLSGVLSAQQSVTSVHFVPSLIDPDLSYRFSGGVALTSTPSFELQLAYVDQLGFGFHYGLGLHGGLQGLHNSGILGFDIMIRFLHLMNEVSFMGWQGQIGYAYTGLGDSDVSAAFGSAFPITTGLVIGGIVRDITRFYFFPAVEFGQTANDNQSFWKSGIGLRLTLGSVISIGEKSHFYLETQPRFSRLNGDAVLSAFTVGFSMGFLFDF
ncbi:MAG: hypothetical protein I8H75_03855 [Myxococcaceae bacterium]|nr:hypothetical protein [Myxococcaceae bacterium]MBH2006462.1 hypothetical protein [Myxococcaceae bacterium]